MIKRSPTYISWMNMIQRCHNKRRDHHENYADRGICVCDRWLIYDNFKADMGIRPQGMTIDRIDNNLGYYKGNCKWSTQTEQCNNRSTNHIISAFGETKTMAQWSIDNRCVVHYDTLKMRLRYGHKPEDAISIPTRMMRRMA